MRNVVGIINKCFVINKIFIIFADHEEATRAKISIEYVMKNEKIKAD